MLDLTKEQFIESYTLTQTMESLEPEDSQESIELFQSNIKQSLENLSDNDLYYLADSQQINIIKE